MKCIKNIFFLLSSVRSKVRGMLEIYHAYIRDLDAAPEPDWDIVDTNETNVSMRLKNASKSLSTKMSPPLRHKNNYYLNKTQAL